MFKTLCPHTDIEHMYEFLITIIIIKLVSTAVKVFPFTFVLRLHYSCLNGADAILRLRSACLANNLRRILRKRINKQIRVSRVSTLCINISYNEVNNTITYNYYLLKT
jgi:hypothetical protein